jgi:hypothetical protein
MREAVWCAAIYSLFYFLGASAKQAAGYTIIFIIFYTFGRRTG